MIIIQQTVDWPDSRLLFHLEQLAIECVYSLLLIGWANELKESNKKKAKIKKIYR